MADPYQPVYLDTAEKAGLFVDSIADVREIALDTEGASFHRYVDRIYLLQLSTPHHSAIIDPLHAGALPKLGALMENREVEVIFHDADYDLRLLRQDYGWHTTHVFDTRIAAQLLGIPAFGLAALLEKFFSVKLDKQHQRADWSMRPLTSSMLDYAAQDTRYLLDLRDELRTGLESLGRMSWAEEEFERLESIQFAPDDPATGFMRTKGARDLKRRELAVLKELVAWRDERAAALDRATFRVMGSEAMFEIARVHPRTREELAAIKGVPRGVVERHRGRSSAVPAGSALGPRPRLRFQRREAEISQRCRGRPAQAGSRGAVRAGSYGSSRAPEAKGRRGARGDPGAQALAGVGVGIGFRGGVAGITAPRSMTTSSSRSPRHDR